MHSLLDFWILRDSIDGTFGFYRVKKNKKSTQQHQVQFPSPSDRLFSFRRRIHFMVCIYRQRLDCIRYVHSIRHCLSFYDNNGQVWKFLLVSMKIFEFFFLNKTDSASVAKQLHEDSFAFIFGINTLIALTFQTILTVVLVSEQGLELDQRTHYRVLSGYFIVLGAIYATTSVGKILYKKSWR